MHDLGISPMMVQGAIRGANLDFPTGYLQSPSTQMAVRLSGKITSVDELRKIVIRSANGAMIRLEDVAEVSDGTKDPVKIGRVNGQEAILINILKQSDANAIEVSKAVNKQIRVASKPVCYRRTPNRGRTGYHHLHQQCHQVGTHRPPFGSASGFPCDSILPTQRTECTHRDGGRAGIPHLFLHRNEAIWLYPQYDVAPSPLPRDRRIGG